MAKINIRMPALDLGTQCEDIDEGLGNYAFTILRRFIPSLEQEIVFVGKATRYLERVKANLSEPIPTSQPMALPKLVAPVPALKELFPGSTYATGWGTQMTIEESERLLKTKIPGLDGISWRESLTMAFRSPEIWPLHMAQEQKTWNVNKEEFLMVKFYFHTPPSDEILEAFLVWTTAVDELFRVGVCARFPPQRTTESQATDAKFVILLIARLHQSQWLGESGQYTSRRSPTPSPLFRLGQTCYAGRC